MFVFVQRTTHEGRHAYARPCCHSRVEPQASRYSGTSLCAWQIPQNATRGHIDATNTDYTTNIYYTISDHETLACDQQLCATITYRETDIFFYSSGVRNCDFSILKIKPKGRKYLQAIILSLADPHASVYILCISRFDFPSKDLNIIYFIFLSQCSKVRIMCN